MAYDVQGRLDYLGNRMKALNVFSVTYKRGANSVPLNASPGMIDRKELMPGVAITQVQKHDWIIDTADLVLGGNATLPQHGDTIERVVGSTTEKYKVTSDGDNQPPYEFTTPSKKRIRIHTTRID